MARADRLEHWQSVRIVYRSVRAVADPNSAWNVEGGGGGKLHDSYQAKTLSK